MVHGSKIKILSYTITWDDAALASHFYEKNRKMKSKMRWSHSTNKNRYKKR